MKSLYIKKFNTDVLLPSLLRKGSQSFHNACSKPDLHEVAALCLFASTVCRKRLTAADAWADALVLSIKSYA